MTVAVFDAMGTLFDLSDLDGMFDEPLLREVWFERLLDSAKALTLTGEFAPFEEIAQSTLRSTLAAAEQEPAQATEIVEALGRVPAYPDAKPALSRLVDAGIRAVVLTNGGREQTERLLEQSGLSPLVQDVVSCEEVRAYKPDARPYEHCCERAGAAAADAVLVAAHAWDVAGARAAGLGAVWIDRLERVWPLPGAPPDRYAADLERAADLVLA